MITYILSENHPQEKGIHDWHCKIHFEIKDNCKIIRCHLYLAATAYRYLGASQERLIPAIGECSLFTWWGGGWGNLKSVAESFIPLSPLSLPSARKVTSPPHAGLPRSWKSHGFSEIFWNFWKGHGIFTTNGRSWKSHGIFKLEQKVMEKSWNLTNKFLSLRNWQARREQVRKYAIAYLWSGSPKSVFFVPKSGKFLQK